MRVSPDIEKLIPYAPGKPLEETQRELGLKNICKLASNENPLGVSTKAVEAIAAELPHLNLYPDPSCHELRTFLSKAWKVPIDQIAIGNGSNELIDLIIRVFCQPGDRILMPEKSFIAYGICAQSAHVEKLEFPLLDGFKVDVDGLVKYFKTSKKSQDKILFLANPNNPTGTYLSKGEMDRILEACGGREDMLVVIDEAYNEFVRASDYPSTTEYLEKYGNVLILRTFSKVYGLAGLRVGAALGNAENLAYLHRVRNPFNVNRLAQKAVIASMQDKDYLTRSQKNVWQGLDYFYTELEALGLPFVPSQGNFVLFDTLRVGKEVFDFCLKQGVVLRPVKEYGLPTHLRMTVGLPYENVMAIEALSKALKEVSVWT